MADGKIIIIIFDVTSGAPSQSAVLFSIVPGKMSTLTKSLLSTNLKVFAVELRRQLNYQLLVPSGAAPWTMSAVDSDVPGARQGPVGTVQDHAEG